MRKLPLFLSGAALGAIALVAIDEVRFSMSANAAASDTYRRLTLFGEVFDKIRSDYVDKPDEAKLIEAAINGMVQSLDPHSSFLDQKSNLEMQQQTRGEFGGLGIEVQMEEGLVKVVTPFDESPAAKAGIQANDLITHINEEQVQGLTLTQAVTGLSFILHDIDKVHGSWVDLVEVETAGYTYERGSNIVGTGTASDPFQPSAWGDTPISSGRGDVRLTWPGAVAQVVIKYRAGLDGNSANQHIGLGNLRYSACVPAGQLAPQARSFSVQAEPVRHRYEGLPKVVQVRGGEYFFMPSLRALNYLCDGTG